jgi:replicative DNA helicase
MPTPDAFFNEECRAIWKIMLELHSDHKPIDLVSLATEASNRGDQAKAYTISTLTDNAPSVANVEYYARLVYEKYMQREVICNSRKMIDKSYGDIKDTFKLLDEHEKLIDDLKQLEPDKSRAIPDIMPDAVKDMKKSRSVIKYNIPALDEFAGGLTRKEITIIGGRPGHGKTTLMLNVLVELIHQGYRVMVFNREMSNKAMLEKLIIHQSTLKYSSLRSMELSDKEEKEFDDTVDNLMTGKFAKNLLLYDDIRDLRGSMREIYKHKPDVVIDDYIQLIKTDEVNGRRFEIEKILIDYKWMCKKVDCSAIILSQLSRDIEKRLDPEPRLADYAESGVIEQVTEAALFVFYGYNFDNEEYDRFESKIIAAKSRYGHIGSYNVGFNGNRCRYYTSSEEARKDGI